MRCVLLLLTLLLACAPSGSPPTWFPPVSSGGLPGRVFLDARLNNQERSWALDALDEHYYIWDLNFNLPRVPRVVTIWVHDAPFVYGPQGPRLSYLAEGDREDEIHVIAGYKATCPAAMEQFHQRSLWPRDYSQLDPAHDWPIILGGVNVQGTRITGLQEQVVNYLTQRR